MAGLDRIEAAGAAVVLAGVVAVASAFAVYLLRPASHWFEVQTLGVRGGVVGQPILMDYERTIHRPARIAWQVKISRQEGGGWISHCVTPWRDENYHLDSSLPDPVNLEWFAWTEPRCYELPAGFYRLEAYWRIWPDSLFTRTAVVENVIFEMSAPRS